MKDIKYVVGVEFGIKYYLENPEEYELKIYRRYPLERDIAERKKIPHEIVFNLVINKDGELLRIKRSKNTNIYPDYHSIPAGHSEAKEINGDIVCENQITAAIRELWEETKLESTFCKRILENKLIYDDTTGHFGVVYAHFLVDEKTPEYNEEINAKESGFEAPELILDRIEQGEKFTPPSKEILKDFLEKYQTKEDLKNYYFKHVLF